MPKKNVQVTTIPGGVLENMAKMLDDYKRTFADSIGVEIKEIPTPWYLKVVEAFVKAFGFAFYILALVVGALFVGVILGLGRAYRVFEEMLEELAD